MVGYTNAGKSSLFNRLSSADVLAKDLLFATLDPAMKKIKLPSGREVILSDTVGFISDLPHELIMAFRATLEEVVSAEVVVHVRDISNPESKEQKQDVLKVLESLGLQDIENQSHYIELFNKIDLLSPQDKENAQKKASKGRNRVLVSALTGEGCDKFLHVLDDVLAQEEQILKVRIPVEDGKMIAWLHKNSEILSSNQEEKYIDYQIRMDAKSAGMLQKMLNN